jgi:pyruvate dehydrogenase E2 component (dihydrolipoamide acetyltransferase)
MRKAIASRVTESLRTMAQTSLLMTVDMSKSELIREAYKKSGIRISYNDIILHCTARALCEHPAINASYGDGAIIQKTYVNLGMAVSLEDGLVIVVIKDADLMTLPLLATCASTLVQKACDKRLSYDETTGGTFTVSNLGALGVDSFTAIINPPEAGILAVGRRAKQVVVVEGEIAIKPMMQLNLGFDHRLIDGAGAALFLGRIKALLENPSEWFKEERYGL